MAKQIIVTQNDYGIELETQFVDDKKKPLDITGYDVRVKIIYDDKTIDTVLAEHKDSINGIAYIVLEKEHLINAGLHTSVWSVVDEDEHVTAQENVYYFVKDVEGSEDDTPTTDLPIDADDILDKFNEIDNNLFELKEQLDTIENDLNSYIYVRDDEDLQDVINKSLSINNATIILKPKRYILKESLIVDLSKIKIKGNGAILDFSQADDNISCIKIIGSKASPYNQNGNFIQELEVVGSGKDNGQVGIEFCSTSSNEATSHINIEKLNIYNFGTGIKYTKYCYLIRHYSVDVYQCGTCVHMPDGGTDYGENILFIGCSLYNSTLAVHNQNRDGDLRFTNCSIDYNYQMMKSDGGRIFFDNGHIEGKHIYECTSVNGSYISVTNSTLVMNDTSDTHIPFIANNDMYFDNNYIAGGTYGKAFRDNLITGDGIVKFSNSKSYNVSDFFTHTFNSNSITKIMNNYECMVTQSTDTVTSKWESANCNISLDAENCKESTKSLKITKTYGVGSASAFSIMIPLNSERFHISFDIKCSDEIPKDTIIFNVSYANIGGYEYNEGFIKPMIFEQKLIGDFKPSLSTNFETMHMSTSSLKKDVKYNALLLDANMFYLQPCSIWIDNIKITNF